MNIHYYRALKAYALVCSWWRSAVRPHIFRFLVLSGHEDFEKLSSQLREEPAIADWIQKVRLQGKSIPYAENPSYPWKDVKEDLDTELYSFPTVLGLPLPNLRMLELVGFAQISPRQDDCKAFAEWIPKLATLTCVSRLNIIRCEMTPNSLTAIVRALPNLKDMSFVVNGHFHPNSITLRDESLAEPSAISSKNIIEGRDEEDEDSNDDDNNDGDNNDNDNDNDSGSGNNGNNDGESHKGILSYPVYHPPPFLRSLYITSSSFFNYELFDFDYIVDWFHPETLNETLESLELSFSTTSSFTARTFTALGASPKLRHLQVQYGSCDGEYPPSVRFRLCSCGPQTLIKDMTFPLSRIYGVFVFGQMRITRTWKQA